MRYTAFSRFSPSFSSPMAFSDFSKFTNSTTARYLSVGIIFLILMVPYGFVQFLLDDRAIQSEIATEDIGRSWSPGQSITAPYLNIPYTPPPRLQNANNKSGPHLLRIMPKSMRVLGEISTEIRYRGIYEVPVYKAELVFSGSFRMEDRQYLPAGAVLLLDQAQLHLGLSDRRGLSEQVELRFGKQECQLKSAASTGILSEQGMYCQVQVQPGVDYAYSFTLKVRGTERLGVQALAGENNIELRSSWPHPSFTGSFLPDTREVGEDGFRAQWRILQLNLDLPEYWLDNAHDRATQGAEVALFTPNDIYAQSERSLKYAPLFVIFVLLALVFSEASTRVRPIGIQYVLVGLSVLLFYVLQIALAEFVGFYIAYWLAAAVIIPMNALYAASIAQNKRLGYAQAALLTSLYGFFFTLLHLQQWSLLIGSLGLAMLLAACMFFTRRANQDILQNYEK